MMECGPSAGSGGFVTSGWFEATEAMFSLVAGRTPGTG
jgi:hypothetical protein